MEGAIVKTNFLNFSYNFLNPLVIQRKRAMINLNFARNKSILYNQACPVV